MALMTQDLLKGRVPALLTELETELRKLLAVEPELQNTESIRKKNLELLEATQAGLEMRGFRVTLKDTLEAHSHTFPVLQIEAGDELGQDLISRNMRLLTRDSAANPVVIYDPVSLASRKIRGSWNSKRQLMSLNLFSLFQTQRIPSTLIHERLHMEKGLAIARRSRGALKPFYGYISGTLVGKSGYARKGFLSVDEAKAWMINLRSREVDLEKILAKPGKHEAHVTKVQYESLRDLYQNYLDIVGDLTVHLEAISSQLDKKVFTEVQFEDKVWHGDKSVFSARVSTHTPEGSKFEYVVPLVKFDSQPSTRAAQRELVAHLKESLSTLRSHQHLIERRLEEAKTLDVENAESPLHERLRDFLKRTGAN